MPKRVNKIFIRGKASKSIFNPLNERIIQKKQPKETPQTTKNALLKFVFKAYELTIKKSGPGSNRAKKSISRMGKKLTTRSFVAK